MSITARKYISRCGHSAQTLDKINNDDDDHYDDNFNNKNII